MTMPAARVGDLHICPMFTGPVPHVGGPVLPPGAPTVLIGGMPGARMGDLCVCVGPPDSIVKGAMPVRVLGQPAARITDSCAHGGVILPPGCPTVLIGLAGISGNVLAGIQRCQAMAAGRNPPAGAQTPGGAQIAPNTAGQSYNNCGVESSRQIIQQATGSNISQEALLQQSINGGLASQGAPGPAQMWNSGGTNPAQRAQILTNNGVPAATQAPTMANLENAVAQGRGVITAMDAGLLPNWPAGTALQSWHAITVTGIEYDANGNPINVIVNDTGMGQCGQRIPYAQFQAALRGTPHVVTNNPIW